MFTMELSVRMYQILNLRLVIQIQLKRKTKSTSSSSPLSSSSFHNCKYLLFHQGFTFPVDCKVGDWKPWGECNATCNGGTKTRAREVVEEPENGGTACPHLEETETCNTDQCEGTLNPILCASIISHILFFGHSLFSSSKLDSETLSSAASFQGNKFGRGCVRNIHLLSQKCQYMDYPILNFDEETWDSPQEDWERRAQLPSQFLARFSCSLFLSASPCFAAESEPSGFWVLFYTKTIQDLSQVLCIPW